MKKANIPQPLHYLIPLVTKWSISDDSERDMKISNAPEEELIELINCISNEGSDELTNWLTGDQSTFPPFSEEYIAYTCFLMAYDYAKEELKSRR